MLIVVSDSRIINLAVVNQVYIEPTNREPVYLKFGSQPVKCGSMELAKRVLAEIADAYEQGAKVYRLPKG